MEPSPHGTSSGERPEAQPSADSLPGKRVHVLHLTPFYPVAGDDASGCFVSEPLPGLERAGVKNTVMAVRPVYRGRARVCESAPPAVWVHYVAPPGGIGLVAAGAFLFARILSEIRRLHEADPVDLIHAHAPLPCGHTAALLHRELGIPYVVSVHGLDAFSTRQVKGSAGRWCKRVSQMVYRSARRVICISERVRDEVEDGAAAPIRAEVVYNGVDPERFSPGEAEPGPMVLSIGNLIPTKGHDLLLHAVAALNVEHPALHCKIIGTGPEYRRLLKLAEQLGIADRVQFPGRQSRQNVARALRHCTVFALPSHYEGLGCVYLEAMATGKPVIACRGQGIAEVIQNGHNGWLADASDVRGLAQVLSILLKDPGLRERMGSAARRTILQGYTLAHQAEQLVRIYRECLE